MQRSRSEEFFESAVQVLAFWACHDQHFIGVSCVCSVAEAVALSPLSAVRLPQQAADIDCYS